MPSLVISGRSESFFDRGELPDNEAVDLILVVRPALTLVLATLALATLALEGLIDLDGRLVETGLLGTVVFDFVMSE